MRPLVSTLLSLCLLSGLVRAASQDGTKIQEKAGHRVKLIYYVTGLTGQTEAAEAVQALKRLPTMTTAQVNLARGYVKVSFDSHEMSYHQAAQAIADVGAHHGKQYDPRVVISVPDYSNPAITPKIKAIFADEMLRPWIRIDPIDEAKGVFFVHFLPLVPDPKKIGTQGFNGGYLTHPIHMAPPTGLALPFKYLSEDTPAIPIGARRPRLLGISHLALYVHDIAQSRAFYKNFLGFDEPYSLPKPDGSLQLTWIKINDRQSVELFPELEPGSDRLNHISIETDNAEGMRAYLAAQGVKVPDKVPKGRIGNSNFDIIDPDGHKVEIVQYEPDGWTVREQGRFLPDTRISAHLKHVGILVGNLAAAQKFYRDILGFREIWRGSRDEKQLSWVHLQVPDGGDFIELMLYEQLPAPANRGTQHHFCLEVGDVAQARQILDSRPLPPGTKAPSSAKVGVNGKRQINYYDPDGTRVEIMEPGTVGGKPAPSSTAPPPAAIL